jgi:hypothetical protein
MACLIGCGEKEAVNAQTLANSCNKLLETSCQRFTDCLPPTGNDAGKTREQRIAECIADNVSKEGSCMDRFAQSECPDEEQGAYVRCEEEVRGAQCSALCSGTDFVFCWHPCLYFCPPKK